MKNKIILLLALVIMAFKSPQQKITLWMIGDSTMSIKETKAYPETGWGMPFAYFFDSSVKVNNLAKNGRSTKTFISEKIWQTVAGNIKEGDYLFIQFGHNDEVKEKTDRYTTPEEFKKNLLLFVETALQHNAVPVLITPVSRRNFDKEGNVKETHPVYSDIVRSLGKEKNVTVIDLDELSRSLYQKMGDENSKLLFMQLDSLEHPNYPNGRKDNTHFNELGARKIAEIVLTEIRKQLPALATRIVVSQIK